MAVDIRAIQTSATTWNIYNGSSYRGTIEYRNGRLRCITGNAFSKALWKTIAEACGVELKEQHHEETS